MTSQTEFTTNLGADIERQWSKFQRYLEWSEGFSLGFLFSSNRLVIDEFRRRLESLYREPVPALQQMSTDEPHHLLK